MKTLTNSALSLKLSRRATRVYGCYGKEVKKAGLFANSLAASANQTSSRLSSHDM
jgi:hypothetical protein